MKKRKQKIFIIDDEEVILDILSRYLNIKGYDTFTYDSAINAIKALPEVLPDLIITDIIMPSMTGIEFIKKIRKYWNIPIIALSGQSTIEHISEAVNYGIDLFLLKPVQPEKLIEEITKLLSVKRREKNYLEYNAEIKKMQRLADFSYLVTGISHEFNTPIQTISLLFYQLDKMYKDIYDNSEILTNEIERVNGIQEKTDELKENFNYLSGVFDNLKRINLVQKKDSSPKILSLKNIIFLVLKICSLNDDISVDRKFTENDDVLGYEEDITRILVNLITNAANAVKNVENPVIKIEMYNSGNMQKIKISDNGCGIEPEIAENIFKPFFTAKFAGYGAGIGLTVAKSLALKMDGDVVLVSSKSGETVFEVSLPSVEK
jgi:signal transduction histidine kinase